MTLFSRELLRSRSSWVALLEEKIRWNQKNDCANWLVSCSFLLFLARVRIVLLTNHEFQIEKYVNFGYFVKWKTEMNTLTLTMSAHGYITYTCLGWLTVKNKMVFGLVDRENKMYTWLVIPKKQDTNETPHGYITYTCLGWLTVKTKWCLGWLTVKTKCTHGW